MFVPNASLITVFVLTNVPLLHDMIINTSYIFESSSFKTNNAKEIPLTPAVILTAEFRNVYNVDCLGDWLTVHRSITLFDLQLD